MYQPDSVTEPDAVVATTSAAPAACAGTVTVIEVAVFEVIVAGVPPKVTELAPLRLVPVNVTDVPPAVGPLAGDTAVSVGADK